MMKKVFNSATFATKGSSSFDGNMHDNPEIVKLGMGTKDGKLEAAGRFTVPNYLANLNKQTPLSQLIHSWNEDDGYVLSNKSQSETLLYDTFHTLKVEFEKLNLTSELDRYIDSRLEPKSFARFESKGAGGVKNGHRCGNAFTDLYAARVHANSAQEIRELVKQVVDVAHSQNFEVVIKTPLVEDGRPTDITSFLYLFPKGSDLPIELQVGHSFAHLAFSINSSFHGKALDETQFINLFSHNCLVAGSGGEEATESFYDMVKAVLLQDTPITVEQKAEIDAALENILKLDEPYSGVAGKLKTIIAEITRPSYSPVDRLAVGL